MTVERTARSSVPHTKSTWGLIRSEAKRLNRRSITWLGAGLSLLFAFVGTSVAFMAGQDIVGAQMPPGMGFPVDPSSPQGVVAGLSMASNLVGILALSLWAAATASDYSSGWIRLMVQAEPRRWRLLMGKVVALVGITLVGTTIVAAVGVALAYPLAEAAGVSTELWSEDVVSTIVSGWANLSVSSVVWGLIGLAIAAISRSAVAATAGGIGYIVVFEGVLAFTADDVTTYLPGSIISAIGAGGTVDLEYTVALALGALLAVAALAITAWVFHRRDITS